MIKLDLKKVYRHLYVPSPKAPVIVDVPAFDYLMIDGQGDPRRTAPEKLKTIIRQPVKKK